MYWLLLAATLANAPITELTSGASFTYQGTLIADKGDPVTSKKSFQLEIVVETVAADQVDIYWTVSEQGRGGWSWLDRIGKTTIKSRTLPSDAPTLLYQRPQGNSIIPIFIPCTPGRESIRDGDRWMMERLEHVVEKGVSDRGEPVWEVTASNAYGRKRTYSQLPASPLVISLDENVFIGQGERYELRYKLANSKQLSETQLAKFLSNFNLLNDLRNDIGWEPHSVEFPWTPDRVQKLRIAAAKVSEVSPDDPANGILRDVARDAKRQANRNAAVAELQRRFVGRPTPMPDLTQLNGEAFDWTTIAKKPTVLHFWDYLDTPLVEPYGQVAYLDFLYRQRDNPEVQVIGVGVHPDFREDGSSAVRSTKKLIRFMNISYPIVYDAQNALRQFGNPQDLGAKLPLTIVLDRQGKIAHYHLGFYEVHPRDGLVELRESLNQVLRSPE